MVAPFSNSLNEERKRNIIDALAGYELCTIHLADPSIPSSLLPDGIPVNCIGSFFAGIDAVIFTSALAAWFDRQRARK